MSAPPSKHPTAPTGTGWRKTSDAMRDGLQGAGPRISTPPASPEKQGSRGGTTASATGYTARPSAQGLLAHREYAPEPRACAASRTSSEQQAGGCSEILGPGWHLSFVLTRPKTYSGGFRRCYPGNGGCCSGNGVPSRNRRPCGY
jgi:hypothetical protein